MVSLVSHHRPHGIGKMLKEKLSLTTVLTPHGLGKMLKEKSSLTEAERNEVDLLVIITQTKFFHATHRPLHPRLHTLLTVFPPGNLLSNFPSPPSVQQALALTLSLESHSALGQGLA
jgi:hypothetical protein